MVARVLVVKSVVDLQSVYTIDKKVAAKNVMVLEFAFIIVKE